jgi:thiosulfate dehydrogenase
MNGKVPPEGDDVLIAVSAYAYLLGMSGLMNQYGIDGPVPELTDEQLLTGGKVDDFPFPAEVAAAPLALAAGTPGREWQRSMAS